MSQPRIVVVLTGGGARGIAQIGVLRELERRGIVPDMIVGSSIGGIIGGLYASGYRLSEIDSIFKAVDWDDVMALGSDANRETMFYAQKQVNDRSLVTLRFRNFEFVPPTAIGGSARFASLIQELLWRSPYNSETRFDSLKCSFRCIATNLADGSAVSLESGNLATAIRASATFPLRYAPVVWSSDSVLVDGGLVANIPTEFARTDPSDIVIVVNTTSTYSPVQSLTTPWAIADQALTAAMKQRDSARLTLADIIAVPNLGPIGTFDFGMAGELILAGEREGARIAPEILRRLSKSGSTITAEEDLLPINSVVSYSKAGADTSADVKTAIMDLTGRAWLEKTRRFHTTEIQRALRKSRFPMAYVKRMIYDSSLGRLSVYVDDGVLTSTSYDRLRGLRLSDIEREVAIDNGNYLTLRELERTWNNLAASDVLNDPDLMMSKGTDSGIAIRIRAEDRGNQSLRIGAKVDNERYTQGGVDIAHENLLSTGIRVSARGMLSPRIGELGVSLEFPRFSGTLWTAGIRGYTSFRNVWIYQDQPGRSLSEPLPLRVDEFVEERNGARISAGRQLERNGVILAEFRYEQQRYRSLTSETRPEFQPIATLRAVVKWDDRDKVDFASKGRSIDLIAESSILSLSRSVSFTKFLVGAHSTIDIDGILLTPGALVGAADRTLPNAELFSLGGQDMFFGWREDQQRGRQIVVANLDATVRLPFRIFFDTYLSLRYDIGAIWENPENIRIGDMNHGVGLTIGIDTPVGPARFSVGRSFFFLGNPSTIAWRPVLAYFTIGARL